MSRRGATGSQQASRVLWALLGGVLLGLAAGLLLQAAIQRTATPLAPVRAFWQLVLFGFSGGLVGFSLSAVSALQASNPDPEYHHPRKGLRPTSRKRPPGDRS